MSSEHDKYIEDLKRSSEAQGWRYLLAGSGHHQFYGPDKHTIVTFAKTPSDWRSYKNSLAEMKRAGYVEPNGGPLKTNLGALLENATQSTQSPELPPKVVLRATAALVEEYLNKHPTKAIHIDELRMYVKAHRPGTDDLTVAQEAARISREGRARRVGYGQYASLSFNTMPEPDQPPPTPTPEPVVAPAVFAPPQVDDDLAELDKALVALSTIESVVRRNRAVLKQFLELKAVLDKLGLKV